MSSPLSLSVIIPTYRRFGPLLETLEDLAAQSWDTQTISSVEIIIADQNPEWPEEFQEQKSTFTTQDNICWMTLETPGVVNARNSAVEKSTGEILLFLDDDVRILNQRFWNVMSPIIATRKSPQSRDAS